METFLGLFAFCIVVVIIVLALSKKRDAHNIDDWPFYPRKPLSAVEQILYFRLVKALPEHIVLAQVQLSRFLGVKKGHNYRTWFNRINRMSADFVVCTKDLTVLAVIELDDATHTEKNRIEADSKKNKALSCAGITIHRWNVKSMPDDKNIKTALLSEVKT